MELIRRSISPKTHPFCAVGGSFEHDACIAFTFHIESWGLGEISGLNCLISGYNTMLPQ